MRIGSLFSGIGGLELGLEWAGLGETVWQVEQCPKLRRWLAERFPTAKQFEDVKEVGSNELEHVELICGGFPCQDISSAGKGLGLSGARSGLWFEFERIIRELQPRVVVVENVASGANKWVDAVRESLARCGYETLPIPLEAADCGAWHARKRIFIIAYSDSLRELQPQGRKPDKWRRPSDCMRWPTEPDVARVVYGFPYRVDYEQALANSVVPQCAEVVGEVIKLMMNNF